MPCAPCTPRRVVRKAVRRAIHASLGEERGDRYAVLGFGGGSAAFFQSRNIWIAEGSRSSALMPHPGGRAGEGRPATTR